MPRIAEVLHATLLHSLVHLFNSLSVMYASQSPQSTALNKQITCGRTLDTTAAWTGKDRRPKGNDSGNVTWINTVIRCTNKGNAPLIVTIYTCDDCDRLTECNATE